MQDGDGAAAAVLGGDVGVAALEGVESLRVAAGGGDLDVAPAHFFLAYVMYSWV